jgi:hypothetical protein
LVQMYYQEAKWPNQKLMSSSQECLGMNRPHKTVEYDLDTVLNVGNRNQTKPDRNVRKRKWPQSQLSPQVKRHAISKEPIKVMVWSPPRSGWHNMNHKSQYANQPRAMATSPYIVMACKTWWHNRRHEKRRPI